MQLGLGSALRATPRVASVPGSTGNKGAAWKGRGSGVRCSSELRTNSLFAGDTAEPVESKLLLVGLGVDMYSEVRLRQMGLTIGLHWTDAMLVPFSSHQTRPDGPHVYHMLWRCQW